VQRTVQREGVDRIGKKFVDVHEAVSTLSSNFT
jgi:hypothetical protein